ncbi:MAG: hypothetical protein GX321_02835 [Clostridiales bacterium]|nr:hypothetical protein [Clostridiales bacterium]
MKSNYTDYKVSNRNTIGLFILISVILLYPDSIQGFLIYIPQLIVGLAAMYSMIKVPIVKPVKYFLYFALYMTIMNFILSIMNSSGGMLDILTSSLRLYYPFLGLIIGCWFRKKIKPESFLNVLVFFLALQFAVSFLQINNDGFRIWSYTLYRPSNLEYYLRAFSWATGRRAIGTVANPNLLGMLIVVLNSSILILSELHTKKRFYKIISVLCTIASLYVCLYTQSRTALLIWVSATALIVYWKFPQKGIVKVFYLCISVIGGVLLLSYLQDRISREISFSALDSRFNIWSLRVSQMFEKARYENFFASILGVGFTTARRFGTFDNSYVKYFVAGGVIGLLAFIGTILSAAKTFFKRASQDIWRRLGLVIMFVWLLGSMVAEYQEMFKLSIMSFIILGYAMYSIKPMKNTAEKNG